VKEYDIFVPITYNDGRAVEESIFAELQARLVEQFEGLTFFPQPNEGVWGVGNSADHDQIVIYRVIASKARPAKRFLTDLKEELQKTLGQEEILIVGRDVEKL
jgi:hypothetical protein